MRSHLPAFNFSKINFKTFKCLTAFVMLGLFAFMSNKTIAQGTWTTLTNPAPDQNGGGMLLLSDGTILCKSFSGTTDGIGNIYNKLTPDIHGSYANGTWSSIAPMIRTRLYYSSQVLKDGRVYVAGGEYGTGGSFGETYNPLTNTWTNNGSVGAFVSDANSEILENGTVLQALVTGTLKTTKIYNPATNTYTVGPTCLGIHNESAWLKLADNSILFVDRLTRNSERYIPALNKWIADATLPVDLYDNFGLEQGGALLLPNGRALFFGSTGHNAIYIPTGNTTPGTWIAAKDFPNGQGTPDAPAAMMVNGKVLCAVSPKPKSGNVFQSPTSFYEYDYLLDSFTRVSAPGGVPTINVPVYEANMIDLPNGQVLFGVQGLNQYYVYTPDGIPLAAGKPKINKTKKINKNTYMLTGNLFNGISEGATYGDDWQMNTNYPIVRLTAGTNVYYARTYNWNSTGLMRGTAADTVYVTPPAGLLPGTYSVEVIANGISSATVPATIGFDALADAEVSDQRIAGNKIVESNKLTLYPNPAKTQTTFAFTLDKGSHVSLVLTDINGKEIKVLADANLLQGHHSMQLDVAGISAGTYFIRMRSGEGIVNTKLIIQ